MNTSQTPQILLVGLPATGKTSFLAALWHYLKASIPNKKLTQYRLSPNDTYLTAITNRWLSCELPDRTTIDLKHVDVEIFLREVSSGKEFILNVPDVAGETFMQQWESRSWTEQYRDKFKEAVGLIFFIHSQNIVPLNLIQHSYEVPQEKDTSDSRVVEWSPRDTPTQVILVELLQFHLEYFTHKPMPVAFVLSAWETELEEEFGSEPAEWLELNMPFLAQFLKANPEKLQTIIYGISAQGGDFKNPTKRAELQSKRQPADRIEVQVGTERSKDISAPIQWLLRTWKSPSAQ